MPRSRRGDGDEPTATGEVLLEVADLKRKRSAGEASHRIADEDGAGATRLTLTPSVSAASKSRRRLRMFGRTSCAEP